MKKILLIAIFMIQSFGYSQRSNTTFVPGDSEFLLNGKPFQILAGEMHYARIPKEYWRHRLKMARAMGLNTVATYVFWNYHEVNEGTFDFVSGNRNLKEFLTIAREEGLWIILRPGPYACAEWDFGGYPWWLLKEKDIVVRSKDPRFLKASERYLKRLGEEVSSLQVTHGGPILMVQVENEYGSYGDDKEFMAIVRDQIRAAGFDVPLFTADGPTQCKNGYVDGVLPAINGDENPQSVIDTVKKYNHGKGPFFIPELYPGWLDHWGEEKSMVTIDGLLGKYDTLLKSGISVSLYMFHGGTNFGFWNGANYGGKFQPQPTSYDYDAPLNEAGQPTAKYFKLREVLAKYQPPGDTIPAVPHANPVIEIPRITLNQHASLLVNLPRPVRSEQIFSMEDAGQGYGYILYHTTLPASMSGTMNIENIRDYATVFLNGKKIASLDRRYRQEKIEIPVSEKNSTLDILVENGGRINYGEKINDNRKGITGQVTINGAVLKKWEQYSFQFNTAPGARYSSKDVLDVPSLHKGTFPVTKVGDTFLNMKGWGKGCVWVNGHLLGKFWYIGPQQTLYCPGAWLKEGGNEIVVFEMENKNGSRSIAGLANPVLNELTKDELAPLLPARKEGTLQTDSADIAAQGEFVPGDSLQVIRFSSHSARYICLQSLSSLGDDPFASAAELYAFDAEGNMVPRDTWSVFAVESEEVVAEDGRAENSFDGNPETIWHTLWGKAQPPHPHAIVLDLGKEVTIGGFGYQSRKGNAPGKIKKYKVFTRITPFILAK